MVKVTVVVPVYNPGPFIEPGIESLLRQSMSRDELEVIYVDDGSTDETPARLDALAAEHPHIRVFHEPNSGWAGRPRNVGIREARGEYVQFMDQDDALTPEALRRLHELATRNRSDIVIGKVASNFRPVPQFLFRHNVEACTIRDTSLISSLTPHKMFRTAFLREHGIEFPEGRRRLEDQLFMVRAYLAALTVSILADTVCYLYARRDDGGNAGNSKAEPAAYFGNLREVLDAVVDGTEPGPFRTELLGRFYRTGMIDRLAEPYYLVRAEAVRQELFREIRSLTLDYMGDDVEATLGTIRRLRSTLMRADREPGVLTLARRLRTLRAFGVLDSFEWKGARLRVEFHADLRHLPDGRPFELVRRDGRVLLDPALLDGVLDEPFEVLEPAPWGHLTCMLRERTTGEEWRVPATVTVETSSTPGDRGDERLHPVHRVVATVNVERIAGGGRLAPGTWELRVRVFGPGIDRRDSLLPGDGARPASALMVSRDGSVAATAWSGSEGLFVRIARHSDAPRLELPLPGLAGGSDIELVAHRKEEAVRLTGHIEEEDAGSILAIPAAQLATEPGLWRVEVVRGSARDEATIAVVDLGRGLSPRTPGPITRLGSRARRLARRAARWLPVPVRRL